MYGTRTRYEKGKAIEALEAIYLSSFEGTFEAVLKTFEKYKREYTKRFIKESRPRVGRYCTGDGTRTVKYQRIWLEMGSDYDGERQLQVWGERDQDDDERTYLRDERKRRLADEEETQRASYERLKRKFESNESGDKITR